MMAIKNYILLVDNHRRPERQRNTAGRYRVGAKTPNEAIKFLRAKIGFGSIQVYYECRPDDKLNVPYKTVVKEASQTFKKEDGSTRIRCVHTEPKHATAPHKREQE